MARWARIYTCVIDFELWLGCPARSHKVCVYWALCHKMMRHVVALCIKIYCYSLWWQAEQEMACAILHSSANKNNRQMPDNSNWQLATLLQMTTSTENTLMSSVYSCIKPQIEDNQNEADCQTQSWWEKSLKKKDCSNINSLITA